MADIRNRTAADLGTVGRTWDEEDLWWQNNFASRPYAAGRGYENFRPAYRYGYESGTHYMGRTWDDVESDLRSGWDRYEHRGKSTWEEIKDAVRDAWNRVTGQRDLDADRMSESSPEVRSARTDTSA
jgi:hypothetical protein